MPRDRWRSDWDWYPPSTPIPVEGGLSTRKQRGAMAETWWSKRFVDVLESYGLGGRMQRGRTYARKGQVLSIQIVPGALVAEVQGSRQVPYDVTIRLPSPTEAQWQALTEVMAAGVGFVARLLAGELPPELEGAFAEAGVPLFPARWGDVRAVCSCPDSGNPCKHIAAVLYVVADQLDDDPWLLLEWMGRTRDELLAPLRARSHDSAIDDDHGLPPWWPLDPARAEPAPLSVLDAVLTVAADPADAVLTRLDPAAIDLRGRSIRDVLGPVYDALASPLPIPDAE